MMMEERQTITNNQLESELQSLRSKATIAKVLTYGSGAAMILILLRRGCASRGSTQKSE